MQRETGSILENKAAGYRATTDTKTRESERAAPPVMQEPRGCGGNLQEVALKALVLVTRDAAALDEAWLGSGGKGGDGENAGTLYSVMCVLEPEMYLFA